MTPRMLSSARKCWPRDFFGAGPLTASGRPKATLALRSICRSSVADLLPPRLARGRPSVWSTLAGSFRLPRSGCGERYGTVRLGEDPVGGHRGGRLSKRGRLRVRHVARERHVVAPLERRLEQAGDGEAVEDDRAREMPASTAAVSASASRVWITTGKPRRRCHLELALEERPLRVAGSEVVEVVEPRLSDRHAPTDAASSSTSSSTRPASGPPA